MGMKKIFWFDTLTPKQTMLFLAIGKVLNSLGFDIIYTTREHDYIHDIFKENKIQAKSIGEYGGSSLKGKLIASVNRMLDLTEYITSNEDQIVAAISFSSPDATRVAYGLGIPLILFNDTVHSKHVGRLTFSLARYLITPSCIDKKELIELGANPEIIHQYNGVDEVEYISEVKYNDFLKLRTESKDKNDFCLVFRPEESFASYMKNKESKPYLEILEYLIGKYNGEIMVFPRYPEQKQIIQEKFEGQVTIPSNGFHYLKLLSKAEIVITGGGTMGREAALLGIPSITYFWRHLEPQKFIEEKRFPSFSVQNVKDAKKMINKLCLKPESYFVNTQNLLSSLEKPSDKLIQIMRKDKVLKKIFK